MQQELVSWSPVVLSESSSIGFGDASGGGDVVLSALSSFELVERLVQVWIRCDQHLQTLAGLNSRLSRARRHLESAQTRPALGAAYIERLRGKRSACLAMLRAERQTALDLMGESDARARASGRRRALGA